MSSLSPHGFDLNDAGWFLHDIDAALGRAGFVRADRAALSAEPFLDHRWREASDRGVALADLPAAGPEAPRLDFIWHTSFCASTLLAACLDAPGQCLALKEPRILVDLADLKRGGALARQPGLAKAVFALLARRFEADERVLVKPSNGANTLMIEAAALTKGRALMLYSDCESFLLSMARKGAAGSAFARDLFLGFAADGHPLTRWPAADLLRLTDLQLAALVWRMQMDMMDAAAARLGERARSLDCKLFLDDPGLVLARIDDFLGLGIGRGQLDEVAAGPLFSRDAKRPGEAYSARSRAGEQARLRDYLGGDLEAAIRTVEAVFPNPPKLAAPLMPSSRGRSGGAEAGLREAVQA